MLLYQALLDRVKRDQVASYVRKHGRDVRGKPRSDRQQEEPQQNIKRTGQQRTTNEQFKQQQNIVQADPQLPARRERAFSKEIKKNDPRAEEVHVPRDEIVYQQKSSPDREINAKLSGRDLPSEFAEEEEERFPCTEGCGKSFAMRVLERHMKICRKNQTKREKFSNKPDPEIEKAKKNRPPSPKQPPAENKAEAVPKWQRQSELFRLSLKRGKGTLTSEEEKLLKELEGDDRVQCAICHCKFDPRIFDRHKNFCENRAKKVKK